MIARGSATLSLRHRGACAGAFMAAVLLAVPVNAAPADDNPAHRHKPRSHSFGPPPRESPQRHLRHYAPLREPPASPHRPSQPAPAKPATPAPAEPPHAADASRRDMQDIRLAQDRIPLREPPLRPPPREPPLREPPPELELSAPFPEPSPPLSVPLREPPPREPPAPPRQPASAPMPPLH